jgi:photosystem II stability/assembly factor-like uncharacterized protein
MRLLCFISLLLCLNVSAQATWQPLANSISNINGQRYDDVFFIDENIGWAANGYYAAVYKTIDGGKNWTEQLNESTLGSHHYFRNIEFLNNDIGFLGTLNNAFFKTLDGGNTWNRVNNITPYPAAICGLCTVGSTTVYGCGAYFTPAYIIKSTDSGTTWEYIDMSAYANALVEIYFLNENIGFVSGRNNNGGTILKTTDGGITWTEIFNSNIVGEYVWKLQILEANNNVIFGSVESVAPNLGKLIKSTDAGITWNSFNAPETDIQAVGFLDENHGWMGGHNTGFYETLNGGQTWTNLNIGGNLNRIFFINNSLAYASGTSIYKFTSETLSTNTDSNPKRASLKISMKNNPVKSYLEFNIHFEKADNILIELYNMNGQFIKQLSRESILTSNTEKEYSFFVGNLASGTYFVNFHNNYMRESLKFIKE